ncbi:hypothetical protein GTY54_29310, partial [Streptomyces sp. SID625]|nr:hypothetical protein [Streptomyces sp. SID625]
MLRRARFTAWLTREPVVRAAVSAAEQDLAAAGGDPDTIWPQLVAEDPPMTLLEPATSLICTSTSSPEAVPDESGPVPERPTTDAALA